MDGAGGRGYGGTMLGRYAPHVAATLSLGLPLIGSHLARMAIGVSDTLMVGWHGVESLAALVIATSFVQVLFFLGMGFGTAVMGLMAIAMAMTAMHRDGSDNSHNRRSDPNLHRR